MFKIGDRVTWSSQAGGRTVTKTGEVVEVVPALERPKTKIKGMGFHRDHESYIVRASKTTDRKRMCKHVDKFFLSLPSGQARKILEKIWTEKDDWTFE